MDEFTVNANSAPFDATRIPHYYGDYVRLIFVAVAAIAALAIPIYGSVLPIGTFAQVAGIIILVSLAGMTNPHGDLVLWADAFVAGMGVLLVENTAITMYSQDEFSLFVIREMVVLLLLVALYYSIKTVRAAANHRIGRYDRPGEFNDQASDEYSD